MYVRTTLKAIFHEVPLRVGSIRCITTSYWQSNSPFTCRDFSTRSSGDSRDFTDDLAEDSLTLDQVRDDYR